MENSIVIKKRKKNSQRREVWDRLKQHPIAMIALAGCLFIIFIGVFADVIVPYSMAINNEAMEKLLPAFSPGHIFGTDNLGRDVFARVWYGARISLTIAIAVALIDCFVGVLYGGISGYFGGAVDTVMMRILEIINGIPYSPDDFTSLRLSFDLYIDSNSIEAFFDGGRYSFTNDRKAPKGERSLKFWSLEDLAVESLEVYTIDSIWR